MPAWPKSFYTFGLGLKTAATEWKLRQKRSAVLGQKRAFRQLLAPLASASHWRTAGIVAGMPYERFRTQVPLHTYASLAPAIERMKQGERDVLWPGPCNLFGLTSGTTNGEAKIIPLTEPLLAHFRHATRDALLYYTVRARHAGVFRGRHLLFGGPTALTPLAASANHQAYGAELTGVISSVLPRWSEKHLYEPGGAAAQLTDPQARMDAIVARTCRCDISLIAGVPRWVAQFAGDLRTRCATSGEKIDQLQQLWPNLEVFVHTGSMVTPYAAELHGVLGSAVRFHEVYAATEAVIAAQDTDAPAAGLRLMADLGIFFEFLPLAEYDETRLAQLGAKAVPLTDVQRDVDYVIVISTPGGLVRYGLDDVVRFVSLAPARLIHRGRASLRLNTFGENVLERDVTDALVAVCSRNNWTIVDFHIAPLHASNLTGQQRGRHEWWVELKAGTVATPTGPQIAAGIDAELQRSNPEYAAKRKAGIIESPYVRLVMPGVFEHWLRYQERWGGQHRLARCRSDRAIAEDLARITNFARD